ncbi:hypothetical protein MG290_06610 [Flavobacterium sp. CBA20B-1]|uniref:hypothetical protein n=1 Tax=unclassified Flavobacterium TaxID=196869 RepID=UPI0022250697|nr:MULTISPECIES: hypothetical protein [unclassified Flavobacterium]WCM43327.1 hypothetical protein MG290_06610 [Flavobacterium sp. CBA20B-1]
MTTKSIVKIAALVIGLGVILFAFMLFASIKTKSSSLNNHEPYKNWVGKNVTLQKETVLFIDRMYDDNDDYKYTLLDSLHPQWQSVDERKNLPAPDLEEIVKFPAGTQFKLEKAIQYTNGVSGFSTPYIFGTILHNGKTYKTGYQWGTLDLAKSMDKEKKSWHFHQAPWQDSKDTAFYELPTAKLW